MSSTVLQAASSASSSKKKNRHRQAFSTSTHSQRGKRAVSLLPEYLSDARAVTQYCPDTAPDGALQLGVAENQMLEDLLVPALSEFTTDSNTDTATATASTASSSSPTSNCFTADLIYYQPTHGRPPLRQAFCAYLERILSLPAEQSLDPEGLVIGAGCNAVLENLCITLAEPGEGVMIPTPYYAAFEFDLVARAGLVILPVNTFRHSGASIPPMAVVLDDDIDVGSNDSISSGDDSDDDDTTPSSDIPIEAYYPTKAGLTATLQAAREEGESPRILLISHPNNPLGISYPPHVVQDCIDWCRDNQIHLISDEIYAGSIHADNNDNNFVSALSLGKQSSSSTTATESTLGDYIHFVYSLSKDFALSGLRVGAVYSENPHIRTPLQKLNDLCQVSSQTQVLVETMVTAKSSSKEEFWTTEFLQENNRRIRARCHALHSILDDFHVPHLKATCGLFCWMDLSKYLAPLLAQQHDDDRLLAAAAAKRERVLYLELMNDFGLLFTPGLSMKNERPGFFRFVFTAASDDEFDLALVRLQTFLRSKEE